MFWCERVDDSCDVEEEIRLMESHVKTALQKRALIHPEMCNGLMESRLCPW